MMADWSLKRLNKFPGLNQLSFSRAPLRAPTELPIRYVPPGGVRHLSKTAVDQTAIKRNNKNSNNHDKSKNVPNLKKKGPTLIK